MCLLVILSSRYFDDVNIPVVILGICARLPKEPGRVRRRPLLGQAKRCLAGFGSPFESWERSAAALDTATLCHHQFGLQLSGPGDRGTPEDHRGNTLG